MVAVEIGPRRRPERAEKPERPSSGRARAPLPRADIVRIPSDEPLAPPKKLNFLGIQFDDLSMEQTIDRIILRADLKMPFAYITTPNVDHRIRIERREDLWPVYRRSWLTLCDSRILEILANLDGIPLQSVAGADLVESLVRSRIKPDEPVNIIGACEVVVGRIKSNFGLTNVNWCDPPYGLRDKPDEIEKIADFVEAHPARFTFICVGSPQQELVAAAIAKREKAIGVGLCCGASLGFLTGAVPRAPRWMRRSALEWLHRLGTEPTRLYRRYLIDGPAIFPIWHRYRRHGESGADAPGGQAEAPVERIPSNDTAPALKRAAE